MDFCSLDIKFFAALPILEVSYRKKVGGYENIRIWNIGDSQAVRG
jgi:hypothetical protein